MPLIRVRQSVAAGATVFPLQGNQYEFLPFPAQVEFAVISDNTGITATIFSGSDVLQQNGPATQKAANAPPIYPDDFLLTDVAAPGERLSVVVTNANAAAVNVETAVKITPL